MTDEQIKAADTGARSLEQAPPATPKKPRLPWSAWPAESKRVVIALAIVATAGIIGTILASVIAASNYSGWGEAVAERNTLSEKVSDLDAELTEVKARERESLQELADRDRELTARANDVAAREAAVQETEDRIAANSFGDGVHRVNVDITPGTYRREDGGSCYWARLSGGGGTFDEIIANDNVDGPATVVISGSDWGFESSRCGTWTKVD